MDSTTSHNHSTSQLKQRRIQDLKIMFWNVRGIKGHMKELQNTLKDLDIFIGVETWLNQKVKDSAIKFQGFFTIRKDRIYAKGGGIVIFVRKNIAFYELKTIAMPDQSVEILGIRITNTTPAFNLFACYRTPGSNLSQDQWYKITSFIDTNDNSILMGDFNAHHRVWNCSSNDTNGERLFNSIQIGNIYLHNPHSSTHIDYYRKNKSNIDLILSNTNFADKISVHVNDEP